VSQPLVVKYELANRLRKLVTLPPALESACGSAPSFRRGSSYGLDRVGGSAKIVRGDVRDGPGLARSVGGMPCRSTQVSGRAHCLAARRASLGHRDLAQHPSAGVLDRLTRSWVLWLSRLEKVKNVLCARSRPQSEEMVIRVGEAPHRGGLSRSEGLGPSAGSCWNSYQLHPPSSGGAHATAHVSSTETREAVGRSTCGQARPRLALERLCYCGGAAQNGSTRDHNRLVACASYSAGSEASVNRCPAPG